MNNGDYYFFKTYDKDLPKPPAESFGQILNETYLHPFDWQGRTTRKSYWISVLCNFILSLILGSQLFYFMTNDNLDLGLKWIDGVVATTIFVWLFLAGLGQKVRRLHDVDYSGYWYWSSLTGYGTMFLFYLSLQPSVQRKVKWGKYLFSKQDYPESKKPKVPVPTIGQILKEHFFDCFKWDARSTRTSYWVGTALNQLIMGIGSLSIYLFAIMFTLVPNTIFYKHLSRTTGIIFLCFCVLLLIILIWAFLAQLGHAVRRLHDAGFNGGWWWLGCVPYLGDLLLSFLLFHPTVQRDVKWNKYLFKDDDQIR